MVDYLTSLGYGMLVDRNSGPDPGHNWCYMVEVSVQNLDLGYQTSVLAQNFDVYRYSTVSVVVVHLVGKMLGLDAHLVGF